MCLYDGMLLHSNLCDWRCLNWSLISVVLKVLRQKHRLYLWQKLTQWISYLFFICCYLMWLPQKKKKSHICEHLLAFIDELEKQLLKNYWSGPIKNERILIFTMLYVLKQRKTLGDIIILQLCTKNLDMMYSSWDIECEKMKKIAGDMIILHMCNQKSRQIMYGWSFFDLLPH